MKLIKIHFTKISPFFQKSCICSALNNFFHKKFISIWKIINMSLNWPNHKELLVNEACLDVHDLDENSLHRHRWNKMAVKYDTTTLSCLWSFSLNIVLWVLTDNRYCWGPISMVVALNRLEPIDCPVYWCMYMNGWKVVQKYIQPGPFLPT